MLVLSRKNGQRVRIGRDIEVTVLEVSGGRVKLGFSAPKDVAIQRNELGPKAAPKHAVWRIGSAVGELCPA